MIIVIINNAETAGVFKKYLRPFYFPRSLPYKIDFETVKNTKLNLIAFKSEKRIKKWKMLYTLR